MCLPALHRLRDARPEAYIAILTPSKLAELWRIPLIDEVIGFDQNENLWSIARKLRAGRFSTGIILPMSMRSALELWLAGIPTRIGTEHRGREMLLSHSARKPPGITEMRKRSIEEVRRTALVSKRHESGRPSRASHHIYRYLNLAAVLGADPMPLAPCLPITDAEAAAVRRKFFPDRKACKSPLFAMCPGSEYGSTKRWPEERFVETACSLHAKTGCIWLLFDTNAERATCQRITDAVYSHARTMTIYNLAGQTSLRELASLLHCCSLALGNDSGPMHLAAAVGTPVGALFSSTSVELTGPGMPGSPSHFVLSSTASCSPCFLRTCPIDMRCMNSLPVDQMVQGILDLCTARTPSESPW